MWPPEAPGALLVVHQHLLAETGTYILENIKTKELVDGGHSEFLFVLAPNRTKGSTGIDGGSARCSLAMSDTQPTTELLQLLRRMVEIRRFEEEVMKLFSKNLVRASTHLCNGQEAVSVGVCSALERATP